MSSARAATLLGAAGLIPFWGLALAAHFAPSIGLAMTALQAEAIWGAVILSFMAGSRWAMILMAGGNPLRLAGFALVSLPALAAPFLTPLPALGVLALAFLALLVAELGPRARAEAPVWYPRLRIALTVGVLGAMALAALAV
ncbi:Protein of unknown function [Meinhardsimonia xiamenensis]|jgi:hypothetical protein|uniref:DUF3429 domain-containing protein n=1 Tax=Meinhardsimonia xiamenensis TaxID=990712 RepID=A0A1G9BA20_9RHOB|nr:DUF3429 domain-containing protein [Meinhardsimonia xiamenensis]PRX35062.1 uncharacterized protein DUF3429 [Meinhardsimonia xiamenensis]SDK36303.1 Protein of unknown function [Meinhardsimonia xiamenensis]